jgi:hypothetical protein
MNELFQITLLIAIALVVSNVIARIVVEVADLLGWEYSAKKEAKRHAEDREIRVAHDYAPVFAHRRVR